MAAQARHYESKSISYQPRQVDDKMIPKSHRNSFSKQSSLDSSPYSKSSTNSPINRKRALDSPNSRHCSPHERKQRMNSDGKASDHQMDSDWSEHVSSSSGKTYYYNKKTEESQWELPKEWKNRDKAKLNDRHSKDLRDSRDSRNSRDSDYNNKDYDSRDRDRDRDRDRYKDKRNYRDSRDSRDSRTKERENFNNSIKDRERDRDRDRYRDCDKDNRETNTPSMNGRYRNSNSGSSRYSSTIKSIGHSTPSSYTSTTGRSYHNHQTPEVVNGTVQDISPPGTPTNDDIMNTTPLNTSTQNPAMFTPHACSPHLHNSMTPVAAGIAPHLVIPTTPHTPLLSPSLLLNQSATISTATLLHPLQQALLIQQQQIPVQLLNQAKELFNSPKLPTVKNHFNDRSCPSSPLVTNFHQNNVSSLSPSMRSNSSTPPPPPPPKENNTSNDILSGHHDRYHRLNTSFDARHGIPGESPREILNRSKSYDNRNDDTTPHRPLNHRMNEMKHSVDRNAKKSTAKLFGTEQIQQQKIDSMFDGLPDLGKYAASYSSSIVDFTNNFYGNVMEKQANEGWNEFHGTTHVSASKAKNNLLLCSETMNVENVKLETSASWFGALDDVLSKIECLRNNLTSKPKHTNSSTRNNKSKQDPNVSSSTCPSPSTTTAAGSVNHSSQSSPSTTSNDEQNSDTTSAIKTNGISVNEQHVACDSTTNENDKSPTPPPPPSKNKAGKEKTNLLNNTTNTPSQNEQVR